MSFWTKKIINISGDTVGVEVNDFSVRVIQISRKGKKDSILGYNSVQIPPGSIIDGEISNKENIIAAVKKAVSESQPLKIKAKKAICSVSETKAFLRVINIPKMKKEEIKEAIKWELEANIPLTIDQVYYDWQMLNKNFSKEQSKISVLVIAVARKIVDQLMEVMEAAGLEVVDIGIESIAQARSLIEDQDSDGKTTLIVDLGGQRTSFLISVGSIPCFTSSIPLSAGSLTDAISKGLNIAREEAETAKKNYGIGSESENSNILDAVRPVLENLALEIEKSMEFYVSGLGYSAAIDKIIICGGGANTKGLIAYLVKRLGREIELGNPWANLNLGKSPVIIKNNEAVRFSTVIGLALKGLFYEDFS